MSRELGQAAAADNVSFTNVTELENGPSSEPFYYPDLSQIDAVCITFIILYLLVMVIAIFGNAAVCYTVLSNRKMQSVVNFYIVNLAICDFMIGERLTPTHYEFFALICLISLIRSRRVRAAREANRAHVAGRMEHYQRHALHIDAFLADDVRVREHFHSRRYLY